MRLALVITLKRGLLLFWALWLSVVVTTNVLDGLQVLSFLGESFRFVSGNWSWINRTMDPLAVPRSVQALMFSGVVLWEALGAALFWRALVAYRGRPLGLEPTVIAASAVNLGLWAAFQVLDEVFLAYSLTTRTDLGEGALEWPPLRIINRPPVFAAISGQFLPRPGWG